MNNLQATKLLNDTFLDRFDINRFADFIRAFLKKIHLQEEDQSRYIPNEFKNYIEKVVRLGKYADNKRIIEILAIKLTGESSKQRARVMQRNFIAKWLEKFGYDAALVAFYDETEDWRFSFVKMEYKLVEEEGEVKTKTQLTPAKRYSYLVGKDEPNHTCMKQFLDLLIKDEHEPTLGEIKNAFSVENVTKEFFERYKDLFIRLKESLDEIVKKDKNVLEEFASKNIDTVEFAKKLLGQIVFLYFLQKKGWLGVQKDETGRLKPWGTGPKNFMRRLFGSTKSTPLVSYNNFFNDILEPLFYEALAEPRTEDFYGRFNCKIPFLNGGLFEPLNDYDWVNTNVFIDNKIFDDILSTFDKFNFTVKEDEPLEREVAVDPEMLGKVFENLLEIKDRKSKGAFYTPREIVHYMCQQSLINYLETNTNISSEDIEKFIKSGEMVLDQTIRAQEHKQKYNGQTFNIDYEKVIPESIQKNYQLIDDLLKEIKIVDPAVGSGAFPVGMMNEIVKARSILSIFFNDERKTYDLKREIIENCLYGVDIMPSAVEICKLRFWLSLIVDETDMQNIKPLPNLDHKIMCGNSLLEEFEGVKLFDEKLLGELKKDNSLEIKQVDEKLAILNQEKGEIARGKSSDKKISDIVKEIKKFEKQKQKLSNLPNDNERNLTLDEISLQRIKESQRKLRELKILQRKFFNEKNRVSKKKYRDEIENIEWELIEDTLNEQGNEEAMQKLKQYKKNKAKPFFLWKLYFAEIFQRENPGFDVVIGNPPYVRQEEFKDIKVFLEKEFHNFFNGRADLYTFFYKKGVELLRELGVLAYISSNKFFVRGYGENTRNFLIENVSLLEIINFGELPVFSAAVDSAIMIAKKKISENIDKVKVVQVKEASEIKDITTTLKKKGLFMELQKIGSKEWVFDNPEKLNLLKKLREGKITLREYYHDNIFAGIKTGLDAAFVINTETRNRLIKEDPNSKDVIKPWFRGKDIRKWRAEFKGLYVLYIPLNKVSIDDYPAVKTYLTQFRKKLENRATDQKWFEMQQPQERFTELFNCPKIIYPDCAKEMRACYDTEGSYGTMAMYFIPFDPLMMGILNSKLFDWYARLTFATFGDPWKGGRIIFKSMYMREVPIPKKNQVANKIIEIVEQILFITKNKDYLDSPDKQTKVKTLEKEIDQLVYKLYELTPEEIKIIEESLK